MCRLRRFAVSAVLTYLLFFTVKVHGTKEQCVAEYGMKHTFHQMKVTPAQRRSFNKEANEIVEGAKCEKPKPTLVPITPNVPNAKFYPDHVWVKRCQGSCQSVNSCLPTSMKTIQVAVTLLHGNGQKPDYGRVEVDQHEACSCDCTVTEENCNIRQEYVDGECACQCLSTMQDAKDKCIEKLHRGFEWDMNLCQCLCKKDMNLCPTGLSWVPEHCQCMKVMDSSSDGESATYYNAVK